MRARDAYQLRLDELEPALVVALAELETTIRCAHYLEHQLEHRRDPATRRFRCYVCEPAVQETPP